MNFKNPKESEGSKIKGFLRRKDGIKLEDVDKTATTAEEQKEFIFKKLTEVPEPSQSYEAPRLTFQERIEKAGKFFQFYKRKTFKDNIPLFMFCTFSCYVLWKMEAQLDIMRRKVIVQKSIKQQEIEKENELIERGLRDNKFEDNVQIQEVEPQFKYRFEEDDDDEEDEGDINTKGDLYVELSKKEKVDFEELPDFEATSDPKYIKKMDNIGRRRKQSLNKDDAYYEETI